MSSSERLHRPEPERTAPIRDASTYLRDVPPADRAAERHAERPTERPTERAAGGEPEPAGGAAEAENVESVVARGVRLGYQVIEEQIAQGQKLAQRLGRAAAGAARQPGGPGGSTAAPGDAGEIGALVERVLAIYQDVGALCVDAIETVARSAAWRTGLARAAQAVQAARDGASSLDAAAGAPAAASAGAPQRCTIDIVSSRRTQVSVQMHATCGAPRVHALHAADAAAGALAGVSMHREPDGSSWRLCVAVPDALPAATYSGLIVDASSNEPCGTVVVRVLPA